MTSSEISLPRGAGGPPAAVGIDVGGTTIKGLLVDERGTPLAERRLATPAPDPTGAQVVDAVARLAAELADAADVPIGVVVPGIVDESRGLAIWSANLGWRDLDLGGLLSARLGRRVSFGHDVRAGAIAEARWGAASGQNGVVAFVAIGTGLSAAVLADGVPLFASGWAGEIGQLRIADGPHAGQPVERIASALGISRRRGVDDARAVAELVAADDARASVVWNEAVELIADAIARIVAIAAPEVILIGGGLAGAGDVLLKPLESALDQRLGGLRHPAVRTAALGDRAAALGAAAMAMDVE